MSGERVHDWQTPWETFRGPSNGTGSSLPRRLSRSSDRPAVRADFTLGLSYEIFFFLYPLVYLTRAWLLSAFKPFHYRFSRPFVVQVLYTNDHRRDGVKGAWPVRPKRLLGFEYTAVSEVAQFLGDAWIKTNVGRNGCDSAAFAFHSCRTAASETRSS